MIRSSFVLFFFLAIFFSSAFAVPQGIPDSLSPWVNWIKAQHPEWDCAQNGENFTCVWPGNIDLTVRAEGAKFKIDVELLAEGDIPLPGSRELPPSGISVQGENKSALNTVEIRQVEDHFAVHLPKGKYTVQGNISWSQVPNEFPLDSRIGRVKVFDSNGADLSQQVQRTDSGFRLEDKGVENSTDALSVRVFRKVSDESPLVISTVIQLRVSGKARSVQMGRVLPLKNVPISITSDLPFQLSAQGLLSLQLTPGEHSLQIRSVLAQPVTEIVTEKSQLPEWPAEEYWAWFPNLSLRAVEVGKDVQALHSGTLELPDGFQGGATYSVPAGGTVELKELRRADATGNLDTIRIRRELWLDLDGQGLTAQDFITGSMLVADRLDVLPETKLGRATSYGIPQLITIGPKSNQRGLEIRRPDVDFITVSRIDDSSEISANGWNSAMENVQVDLHIPPSWQMIHVSGASTAVNSWVESWSLLELFVAALLVLAGRRLFGNLIAAILLFTVILNHHEHLAPGMLIIHLLILAAWKKLIDATPAKEVPQIQDDLTGTRDGALTGSTTHKQSGLWRTICNALLITTFIGLTLQSLTFAKLQFTQLLFPQLQAGTRFQTVLQNLLLVNEASIFAWPALLALLAAALLLLRWSFKGAGAMAIIFRLLGSAIVGFILVGMLAGILVSTYLAVQPASRGYHQEGQYNALNAEPEIASTRGDSIGGLLSQKAKPGKAVVEQQSLAGKNLLSGAAIPNWRWRTVSLMVQGPVNPEHRLSFTLMSPTLTRLICGVRTVLAILLILALFRALNWRVPRLAAGLHLLLLIVLAPGIAKAQLTPGPEILQELEMRLKSERCSRANCALIRELGIKVDSDKISLKMEVSSDGISSFSLPGPLDTFLPAKVVRNGIETVALRRNSENFLEVATVDGNNVFEVSGPLPQDRPFSLQFASSPVYTRVEAVGWTVEGLLTSGAIDRNLRFVEQTAAEVQHKTSAQLSSWFTVKREIKIAEQVTAQTLISRLGDLSSSVTSTFPLLDGEQVSVTNGVVEPGKITLNFAPGESSAEFESSLSSFDLQLVSKPSKNVSENWILYCSPFVSCAVSGLAPVVTSGGAVRLYEWTPFPGETVSIKAKMLETAKGNFITIDSLEHRINYGPAVLQGEISAQARSTEQSTLTVALPKEVKIEGVKIDGLPWSIPADKSEFPILLNVGTHSVQFKYQAANPQNFTTFIPQVKFSVPTNNITTFVSPGEMRWLIWTGGSVWGPSVVYWAKLICILAICVTLSFFGFLPMNKAEAVFLGIGLTSLPILWLSIPLIWLIALKLPSSVTDLLKPALRTTLFMFLTFCGLMAFYAIVRIGLVLEPPMLVAGNGSTTRVLRWFIDHATTDLPTPYFVSFPMWYWRAFSWVWSVWLVVAILRWLGLTVKRVRTN